jgi:hypothetical protein
VTVADLRAGLFARWTFSGTARREVKPPGAVARLVLCLFARAVTLRRIGISRRFARMHGLDPERFTARCSIGLLTITFVGFEEQVLQIAIDLLTI